MNFTDDPVPFWAFNFPDDPDAFNGTTLDIRALETFLVMPVSAAGKAVGESVVEVIDEAITALLVVVMVVIVLAVVGATALVVVLVRRRRRRQQLAARGGSGEAGDGEAAGEDTALEMAVLVEEPLPASPPDVESALNDGADCENDPEKSDISHPE